MLEVSNNLYWKGFDVLNAWFCINIFSRFQEFFPQKILYSVVFLLKSVWLNLQILKESKIVKKKKKIHFLVNTIKYNISTVWFYSLCFYFILMLFVNGWMHRSSDEIWHVVFTDLCTCMIIYQNLQCLFMKYIYIL